MPWLTLHKHTACAVKDSVPRLCLLPTPKHLPQVWVLTGDKMETAISIGVACRLLSPAMRALVLRNADFEGLQARGVSAMCRVTCILIVQLTGQGLGLTAGQTLQKCRATMPASGCGATSQMSQPCSGSQSQGDCPALVM